MARITLPHSHLVFRNLKLTILFRLLGEIAEQSFFCRRKTILIEKTEKICEFQKKIVTLQPILQYGYTNPTYHRAF